MTDLFSLSCTGCRWITETLGRLLPVSATRPLAAYGSRRA